MTSRIYGGTGSLGRVTKPSRSASAKTKSKQASVDKAADQSVELPEQLRLDIAELKKSLSDEQFWPAARARMVKRTLDSHLRAGQFSVEAEEELIGNTISRFEGSDELKRQLDTFIERMLI